MQLKQNVPAFRLQSAEERGNHGDYRRRNADPESLSFRKRADFPHEKEASEKFREINGELREYNRKATFYSSLTNPTTRFINNLIYAAVALIGSFQIFGGALTIGGLSVMLNYANQYMKPFNDISSVVTELQNALACAARIFALIDQEPEKDAVDITKAEDTSVMEPGRESVEIDQVSFSYTKDKKLIEDFSLSAKPGMIFSSVWPI